MGHTIHLDGSCFSLETAALIARGYWEEGVHHYPVIELAPGIPEKLREFRVGLEKAGEARAIYGYNTGCGSRKCVMIPHEEIDAFQAHYIPAHCVGFGNPFPEEVVRLAIALRVNSFTHGHSGVRVELCEALLALYNRGVIPFVPEKGSVGSSGDLCPLAHVSAVIIGLEDQEAWFGGALRSAPDALRLAELEPIVLKGKEAMALTNGATFTNALGLLATHDAMQALQHGTIAAALSLEAVRGEKGAFDERIHKARRHEGEQEVAAAILDLTAGSVRMTDACRRMALHDEHKKHDPSDGLIPRVQDAYSFRCWPQVAGPALQLLQQAEEVFVNESGAATDNPLIFREVDGSYTPISGGNFHGEGLGHALNAVKLAMQSVAGVGDRQFYALLDPCHSYGLPPDLAGSSELNTGLMIAQYLTAGLYAEGMVLAHPAVASSVPTSAGQEDYVAMATIDGRLCRELVENTTAVVAWHLIAAAQGISLTDAALESPALGRGTAAAFRLIRETLPAMDDDRYLRKDHLLMLKLMAGGKILEVVSAAIA